MEYSTGKCTSVLCHHQQSQQRFELRTGGVCLSESLFQPITVRFLLSHWISIFVAPRWQQTLQKHTHTVHHQASSSVLVKACRRLHLPAPLGEGWGISQPASVLPAPGLIGVQPSYYPGAFVNYQPSDVYH